MVLTATQTAVGPALTEAQAREIFAQGEEAVVFALLQLSRQLALQASAAAGSSHDTPATPSGMKPPFAKPTVTGRKKRPGRKAGHVGSRRELPTRIDEHQTHRAEACPDCGGPLHRCAETRVRYTEDIRHTQPIVTAHTIHRDWCPECRKKVEPVVPTALRGSPFGHRMLALTAWLHYALGNTLSQIVDVFDFHLQLRVTPGGLVQMWARLADVLQPWYQQIHEEALKSAVLHGDESGWRVNGKTHWLWCFASPVLSYFMIDRSRGQPALRKFFTAQFSGILVTDFWGAYNAVAGALRQTCLVHLLRDLEHVEKYKSPGEHWLDFAKKLRRLIADAIRLWRHTDALPGQTYASRRERLTARLDDLIHTPWQDGQARRLIKRLRRHQSDLFTFLDQPDVPFDNNLAERAIRPAVIIRKNSYGNRSDQGAEVQAILMSIFFTLKKRGHNPIHTIETALTTYMKTGQLPQLPAPIAAGR
jgi:transposase